MQIKCHAMFLFPLFIVTVGGSAYGELRVIKIQNLFPHHVSLHYDDSEAGTFLTIIGSNEISKVKAGSGMYVPQVKSENMLSFSICPFNLIFLRLIDKSYLCDMVSICGRLVYLC
jgi:hypothetical protein